MKTIEVTCPCCNHEFTVTIAGKPRTVTPALIEANKERARKPRPGAQGKKKPRKPKAPPVG